MIRITHISDGTILIKTDTQEIRLAVEEAMYVAARLKEVLEKVDKTEKNLLFPFSPTSNYAGRWETGNRKRVFNTDVTQGLSKRFDKHAKI